MKLKLHLVYTKFKIKVSQEDIVRTFFGTQHIWFRIKLFCSSWGESLFYVFLLFLVV